MQSVSAGKDIDSDLILEKKICTHTIHMWDLIEQFMKYGNNSLLKIISTGLREGTTAYVFT